LDTGLRLLTKAQPETLPNAALTPDRDVMAHN
jgi:hypothetical protein